MVFNKNQKTILNVNNNSKTKKVATGLVALTLLGVSYENVVNNSQNVNAASTSYDDSSISSSDLSSPNPVTININKDNFLNYFELVGDASYNQSTGTITLTQDAQNESGGVTLKNKVSLTRSFSITGSIYAGNKLDTEGGADGLAIFFHPNRVGFPISTGGAVGMYQVPNAFGFKVDTFYDKRDGDPTNNKNQDVLDGQGASPFGAFTYTNDSGQVEQLEHEPTVSYLNKDDFLNSKADFVPFILRYDASTKEFQMVMDGYTWTKEYTGSYSDLALVISAATGLSHNLQQVRLDTFSYSASPIYLAQQKSMDALKNEAQNVVNTINNDSNLSSDQKQQQITNINNELQKGLDNIQKQTTVDDVQSVENKSKTDIDNQYLPGHPAQSSSDNSASSSSQSNTSSSAQSSSDNSASSNSQSSTSSSAQSSSDNSASSSSQSSTSSSAQSSSDNSVSSISQNSTSSSAQSSSDNSASSISQSNVSSSAQSSSDNSNSLNAQSNASSSTQIVSIRPNHTNSSSGTGNNKVDNHFNDGFKDHRNNRHKVKHPSIDKNEKSLPQTGDQTNKKSLAIVGLIIGLIGLGMATIGFRRKNK
ncbi:MAG: DUF1542 domain-containing protein [Apilactobacillus sp.]|uniref:lectin-like domain-containing protein n=1 Tax=Apilactobacillus TaxID=2767877 RepID=UPI0025E8A785|nr:DUF1542 domain-containing protein [Apilactobacillus sp.]MCT6823041.1 DUF1542 domain-containing protein [Apilactobacillus sp.]MCT6858472.1 DUF1542 domain-containing protein [Apilactobacillus sp.]